MARKTDTDRPAGKRTYSPKALIEAAFAALDDVAELRRSAQFIADNIAELSESAAGINRNAETIANEITTLTAAAAGIDSSAEKIAAGANSIAETLPRIQRLAEVVDPLESTVARLGWVVDRIPGGKRS
jgi:methyl-accepting chemotaxis protein